MTAQHGEAYEKWAARLELRLALQPGMDRASVEDVLGEVAGYCAETGESPREAFGDPDEYAVRVARERDPVGERAGRDWAGLRPADYLRLGMYGVAVLLVVGSGLLLVRGEWWVNLTFASVAGSVLVVAATMASGTALALRAAGRARVAAAAAVGMLVLVVAAAMAFLGLSRDPFGRLPVWVFAVCGALLALLAWRLEPSSGSPHRAATTPGQETGGKESAAPGGTDPSDADRWLGRLGDLLTGRHGLPRSQVRQLVADARLHLTATGCAPSEEFGPVEVYALELADQAGRRAWWTREGGYLALFGVLFAGYGLDRLVNGDFGWALWVCGAALALTLLRLTAHLLKTLT
ncbi:hypothetical protein [Streptomyces sp. NBC_00829]|uniref:hypothetical protein n=1 Tax=Streptomyces sp. NBC_00829 TaxID=2903679 RepID=UPI0038679B16|nr:hypothetical protein OG293_37390 [Streptomyces sp. NBC_00829]